MIAPASMDNERLGQLIRQCATKMIEDQPGYWKFEFDGTTALVMTDETHNRMRIITPVADVDSVPSEQWLIMMSANFDRALDARYCVKGDTLWSAFIHPLAQLSGGQFMNGLQQVVTLAKNYGTSYSSGDLFFNG